MSTPRPMKEKMSGVETVMPGLSSRAEVLALAAAEVDELVFDATVDVGRCDPKAMVSS
jgi:hypothetical protein